MLNLIANTPTVHTNSATHLEQHGTEQAAALQQLEADVHVEGHLAPLLQQLLLGSLVLELGHGHALFVKGCWLLRLKVAFECLKSCLKKRMKE